MCNQAWPRACRWTTVHPPPCRHLGLLELPAIAQVRAQRGRIDLGLLLPPVDGAEIITDPVWSEEWLAALPKAHPLVRRTKLHATDFDGQNVIIGHAERGPRCGWHVLDLLDTLHVKVRTIAEVERLHTALMLVQAGAGIAFVPGALADVSIAGCVPPVCAARGRIIIHAAWPDGMTTGAGGAIPACRARRNARWLTRQARRRRGEHHT
jgi:DNA-binding transcriptional LysR family regulator